MVRIPSRHGAPIPAADRHDRLRRTFPGERIQQDTGLTVRVFARNSEKAVLVRSYKPKVRLVERTVRVSKLQVQVEPNAPLLARIVKNPYAETTASPRRIVLFEAADLSSPRVPKTPRLVDESRAARGSVTQGNPVKSLDFHPVPLPAPPSIDEWLASREA